MRGLIGLVSLSLVAGATLPASAQSPLERGRYLVEVVGASGDCHTPTGPDGDLPGKHLTGGFQLEEPFAYLRSLPPVRNKVPAPEPPKKP